MNSTIIHATYWYTIQFASVGFCVHYFHCVSDQLVSCWMCITDLTVPQAVHEDLVKGFKHCLQKRIEHGEEKVSVNTCTCFV